MKQNISLRLRSGIYNMINHACMGLYIWHKEPNNRIKPTALLGQAELLCPAPEQATQRVIRLPSAGEANDELCLLVCHHVHCGPQRRPSSHAPKYIYCHNHDIYYHRNSKNSFLKPGGGGGGGDGGGITLPTEKKKGGRASLSGLESSPPVH